MGVPVTVLASLTSAQITDYRACVEKYGFISDRIQASIAIAGAAMCRSSGGGNVHPKDLLPRTKSNDRVNSRTGVEMLAAQVKAIEAAKKRREARAKSPKPPVNKAWQHQSARQVSSSVRTANKPTPESPK